VLVAWTFVAALLAQLFLSGLAVFVAPGWWVRHVAWVHVFQWLAPAALGLALAGRSSRVVRVLAVLVLVVLFLQYTTAEFRLVESRHVWAALHPVSGFLLLWVAIELGRRAWRDVDRAD
jgi:hypothetical protein